MCVWVSHELKRERDDVIDWLSLVQVERRFALRDDAIAVGGVQVPLGRVLQPVNLLADAKHKQKYKTQ